MEPKEQHSVQVGDKAPGFNAPSTKGEIRFPEDYRGKWVVFFSYTADFTPVSCTEFLVLGSMMNEFKVINTELLAISPDSLSSHIAWLHKIKELIWKDIKHIEITFPLISDQRMEIMQKFGMLPAGMPDSLTSTNVFIIDPTGVIRAAFIYPIAVGINIKEIKRLILAVQCTDREKVEIPAGWIPGEDVILRSPDTYGDLPWSADPEAGDIYSPDWFICFKQSDSISQTSEKQPEVNPYPSMVQPRRRQINRR